MPTALSRLVDDAPAFRAGWPTNPTLYTRTATDLAKLGNHTAVRQIVSDPDLRPTTMGMVRDGVLTGEPPHPDHPTSTLVLNGLHNCWPPLMRFCRELSTQLGHPITGNIYRTPAGAANGFAWHWDCHHVFIAQTEGSKNWELHPPVIADPLEEQRWGVIGFTDAQRHHLQHGEPHTAVTLHAGEVLFIPRGWIHRGQTTDEQSLHVTLGVQLLTRHWVLEQLTALAKDNEGLRTALPPDLDGADMPGVFQDTRDSLMTWLRDLDPTTVVRRMQAGQRQSVSAGVRT